MVDGGWIDDDDFERAFARDGRFRTLYVRAPQMDEDVDAEAAKPIAALVCQEAVQGNAVAQTLWGHLLLKGFGVEREPPAALRWFLRSARFGDAEAINMVGRCYENGWGAPADLAEAARWYRRAAGAGHAWAQFNLATLLAQGRGVAPDPQSALTLLVRSARQGNPKAMNMLGRYREGNREHSPTRALRSAAGWYRRAARRGCFRGQYHHGRLLAGAGQVDEAIQWFKTSLSRAPQEFRKDALHELGGHPDSAVRALVKQTWMHDSDH